MSEIVLAFKREIFPDLPYKGFLGETSILPYLLSKAEPVSRDEVEQDPTYKQLVVYSILRYEDSLVRYQRSPRGGESRLHGLYSIGWGGHVNVSDNVLPLWDDALVRQAAVRELQEEIDPKFEQEPRLIGLLNDDSNEVGVMHFGIVYEYWLASSDSFTKKKKQGQRLISIAPLGDIISHESEYEEWSRIILSCYIAPQLQESRQ